MPELPEVETVARALDRSLRGMAVDEAESIGKLRLPFDAEAASRVLAGRRILGVRRRAKYILFDFSEDWALLAHLGMTGRFRLARSGEPREKHDRAAFRLNGEKELLFSDARRFGFVKLVKLARGGGDPAELARLGPEPLDRSFSGKTLSARAAGRKTPAKAFLMDQEVVVGVGNIYASEALYAAGIDPRRPAGELSPGEWTRVSTEIKTVLRRAIAKGGSTIRSYRAVDGSEGGFQRSLHVYGKAGCACGRCGEIIQQARLGGRSTFYCPRCQT